MTRLLIVLYCLCAAPLLAETRAAFVVGNAAYANAAPLQNPANDSALLAETLRTLDFTVARHENLDRSGFSQALSDFLAAHDGADVMLFYFAGHGMQFEGRNYLVPTDAALRTELDIESETLALDRVVDLLQRRAKSTLVFVDACRDNPLAESFYRENFSQTRAMMTRGLAPMETGSDGAMVVFSASPGQVAFDGEGDTSAFAAAVARHLPTENAEVLSLMKRVIRDVKGATGNKQVPMVRNDLVTEIFLRRGEGADGAAIAYREEERLFEAAEAIGTPRAWTVYFERFPDGAFHQQALTARETATAIDMAAASGTRNAAGSVEAATRDGARVEIDTEVMRGVEGTLDRDTVRRVQAALNERGYDAGPADGVLGQGTRRALADFQLAMGLPSTGALTAGTAAALGIEVASLEADDAQFVASQNARRYDPLQLALIEDDKRLLRAVEALRQYELVYGYREDRLYIGVLTWRHDDFISAQALAEKAGGYLATLTSAEENQFAYDLVKGDRRFWQDCGSCGDIFGPSFGLYQKEGSREPNGGWVWITGESLSYTNWIPGEPGNHNNNEYFGHMMWAKFDPSRQSEYADNRWGDLPASSKSLLIEIE